MSRGRERLRRDLLYDDPIDCGVFSYARDKRFHDETRTVSEVHRFPENLAVYGLLAGHGGSTAAELCARNFVPTLLEDSTLKLEPESAIRNACKALEAFVLAKSALDRSYYGTTLLVALIKQDKLYIANIGNSRAVIVTEDGAQVINEEHDGSNAEEVARVRNAGGFFQDGKVNNLIRVTRSIGDLELKERKHVMFPNRKMTEDIVIAVPDIYCRRFTSRDEYLIIATAEVWEKISTKVIVQLVNESLHRGENARSCAKKVASAAVASGAKGSVTVMILLFPGRRVQDKQVIPPKRRPSRHQTLQRHSSNAEQELRSMKEGKKTGAPAFVIQAQAEEAHRLAVENAFQKSSPIASPASTALNKYSQETVLISSSTTKSQGSQGLLHLDIAPSSNMATKEPELLMERKINPPSHIPRKAKIRDPSGRSLSTLETEVARRIAKDEMSGSRKQYDPQNTPRITELGVGPRSRYVDDVIVTRPQEKAMVASRISELTASGATGGAIFSEASVSEVEQSPEEFIDYSVNGPSKVRYNEDGTVQHNKFGFLKDLGKTFVRRR